MWHSFRVQAIFIQHFVYCKIFFIERIHDALNGACYSTLNGSTLNVTEESNNYTKTALMNIKVTQFSPTLIPVSASGDWYGCEREGNSPEWGVGR